MREKYITVMDNTTQTRKDNSDVIQQLAGNIAEACAMLDKLKNGIGVAVHDSHANKVSLWNDIDQIKKKLRS